MRVRQRAKRRKLRQRRARARLSGTSERPRLSVYRSLNNVYAQLVDDVEGKTLVAASSLAGEIKGKVKHGGNREAASKVGELIAQRALACGIKKICFDRGGLKYHGCVARLAEAARQAGLEF